MLLTVVDIIPIFGALLILVLLLSILLRSDGNMVAEYYLLLFLFICFLSLLHKFLNHSGFIVNYIHLTRLHHLLGILRPPLFFLYIYHAIKPGSKFRVRDLAHFIPFVILCCYMARYVFLPADVKSLMYSGELVSSVGKLPGWYSYWGLVYSLAYLTISFVLFRRASIRKGFLKQPLKRWLAMFLIAHLVFIIAAVVMVAFRLGDEWDYLAFHAMTLCIVACCVVLLMNAMKQLKEAGRQKQVSKHAPDDRRLIFENVQSLINTEKIYLSTGLRAKDVAMKVNLPEYVLSQIINECAGVAFPEFINQSRIEYAKNRLTDRRSKHLTIEAIGLESGFSTKSSFYTAFKKQTGITPTEFRQKGPI